MIPFLLALQAAGMVTDYLGRRSSIESAEKGYQLQQQMIEQSIRLSRLQTEDESLRSMQTLRQNLGTQISIMAARGNRGSAGIIGMTESISNQGMDERMRRINQQANEARLRAGMEISKLNFQSFKNDQWSAFAKRSINTMGSMYNSTPSAADPSAHKGFGASFGLNKVSG